MDKGTVDLEREYCPPLDSALFHAIVGDFDLTDEISLVAVRETLDTLRDLAENDDATHFDSTGTANSHDTDSLQQSLNDEGLSGSGETKPTTDTSISALEDDTRELSSSQIVLDIGIDDLEAADKEAILSSMFPEVKGFDISSALRKANWNFMVAVDEILTQVYLAEGVDIDGNKIVVPKGIDGFALQDDNPNRRKGKGKSKKKQKFTYNVLDTHPLSERSPNPPSKWDLAKKECDFISRRTMLPEAVVTSCYHKSGGNLRQTILVLCELNIPAIVNLPSTDTVLQENTSQLQGDFPDLAIELLNALIRLTHPSTSAAHELAKAIFINPITERNYGSSSVTIVPKYAPLDLSSSPPLAPGTRTTAKNLGSNIDHTTASSIAQSYAQARFSAFEKANAAYRKSRSTPIMAAAAGYYASVGRDAEATSRHYSSLAAENLAAKQSTSNGIDLHGINVHDAVRITKERVQGWWAVIEEARARTGKVYGSDEYRVVTGVGTHSDGGRAKLFPAIKKMLASEGWKVDLQESGVLTVTGKARK